MKKTGKIWAGILAGVSVLGGAFMLSGCGNVKKPTASEAFSQIVEIERSNYSNLDKVSIDARLESNVGGSYDVFEGQATWDFEAHIGAVEGEYKVYLFNNSFYQRNQEGAFAITETRAREIGESFRGNLSPLNGYTDKTGLSSKYSIDSFQSDMEENYFPNMAQYALSCPSATVTNWKETVSVEGQEVTLAIVATLEGEDSGCWTCEFLFSYQNGKFTNIAMNVDDIAEGVVVLYQSMTYTYSFDSEFYNNVTIA